MDLIAPGAVQASAHRQASLVWSPHPLLAGEGRVIAFDPPTGAETLHAYLVRLGVDLSGPVIVAVDRAVIPRDWLTRVRPKPGTLISVRAAVAGGDGSQVVAIVAMIAISIVAPYLAGAAYGLATSGTALTMAQASVWAANTMVGMAMTAGITIAGSMAISALMPKPKVDLGRALSSAKDSPTYSLSGGSNRARPYEPMGLTLGRHRVFFDLASNPYAVFENGEQYLYQVFHIGMHGAYGPLRVEDLRIGTTPLENYQDVTTEFSSDAMPTLMPYNVDTVAGAAITVADGAVLRTTSIDTTRIEVDLQFVLFYTGNSGLDPRSVTFQLEYRPVGGAAWLPIGYVAGPDIYTHYWSQGSYVECDNTGPRWKQTAIDASRNPSAHTDGVGGWRWRPYAEKPVSDPAPPAYDQVRGAVLTLSGASATPMRRTYGVDVASGQYEVRCSRITPDETDSRATSDINFVAVKCYQSQPGDFVGQTFLAVKVKASGQLNGTLSTLSGVVYQPAGPDLLSSNPADLYLLFARGYRVAGRLIWGAGLADADIDLASIDAWRTWCVTKSLSCNLHIDSAKSVWDIMQAVCRCGRASPSWSTGKLGVLWDAGDMPIVAVFGPSNIKRDTFEVTYGSEAICDEVTLSFVDAAADYKADTIRVAAPGVATPLKPASIELWGCTDRDQAIRECRLQVAHQLYRTRQVTWVTDMEGLVVTRGDVVALSHDLTQWGTSGRLVGGSTLVLYLDRTITLDAGGNWITVVEPNGTMHTCRVQYVAGDVTTVTLLDALPSAPDDDNPIDWRWLADYQATPGKRVKITDIKPASMHEVRITAMDDPDEYYAFESGTYTPPAVRKWTSSTPEISGIAFGEELVRAGAGYAVRLNVSWTETGYVSSRQVKYRLNADPWIDCGLIDGSSIRLDVPDSGTVMVVVVGYDGAGQVPVSATASASHVIAGRYAPPPAVTGFAVSALADGTRVFTWSVTAVPPDTAYLDVRYSASPSIAWDDMTLLGSALYKSGRAEGNAPGAGTWTFEARLRDGSGINSATGPRVTTTLSDPGGVLIAGVPATSIATAVANFNGSNDRNASAIVAPTIASDGTAIDHVLQADGSADISFEWAWAGSEGDIDGFLIVVRQSSSAAAYTFGASPAEETAYTIPASKRAFIVFGTAANQYYTFGVQAYRSVDKDINAAGVIKSALVKSSRSDENPYRPSASVAFSGNVTGTINNIPATNVNSWNAITGTGKPADNATVGASWGTNIVNQPADDALLNSKLAANRNLVRGFRSWNNSGTNWVHTGAVDGEDGNALVIPNGSVWVASSSPAGLSLFPGMHLVVSYRANPGALRRTLNVDLYPDSLPESSVLLDLGWKTYSFGWDIPIGIPQTDLDNAVLRFFAGPEASQVSIVDVKLEASWERTPWIPHRLDAVTVNNKIDPNNVTQYVNNGAMDTNQLASYASTERVVFFDAVGVYYANYG